jgi:hypothetical protein
MRTSWGAVAALCSLPSVVLAGGTIKIGENQSVTVGGGLRTSINFVEDGAPSGDDFSHDFTLNSARLYLGGQVTKGIFAEFNTELNSGNEDSVRVLDAVVKIEYTEGFRIWAGRFLPPSDRANLDGPYYMPLWNYPFVSGFPAIFAGRDDGVAVWGQFKGGKFKYQTGVFQGTKGGPNQSDSPLLAGRAVLNLRDPEPGYYNSSTYWGSKKILAVAVTAQAQSDAAGTVTAPSDFSGLEVDVLFEQPMSGGSVFTAEGAFYNFDWGKTNSATGSAFYAWAGYLLGGKMGPGQLQPIVRYQSFDSDVTGHDTTQLDAAVNYIVAGDNARFHATYSKLGGDADGSSFSLGAQLQF